MSQKLSWDVQQGGDDALMQLAGEALVLRTRSETDNPAALIIGVESEAQADRVFDTADTKHMRELG